MLLVVDTNVIISAAIARSYTLDLIFDDEIIEKTGLNKEELERVFDSIFSRIATYPKEHYEEFKQKAINTSPDENDWPFFALALKHHCPILSNDKQLKKQAKVKIISIQEITQNKTTPRQVEDCESDRQFSPSRFRRTNSNSYDLSK